MVNAWSLLYEELNGTMNETFPIKNNKPDDTIVISTGSTESAGFVDFDLADFNVGIDTSNYVHLGDTLSADCYSAISGEGLGCDTLNINIPSIEKPDIRKYEEDKSIKALQNYISTTYGGHYTSKHNNVQTLDLIESVGDAEAFCRSNAIKYLSRYDKKGQAKRDLLKAMHYSLLLYYFSGHTNETPTRGYETF